MSRQDQQVRAAQLQAQEAANYNQRLMEGMQNAAPPPRWRQIAAVAVEMLAERQADVRYWRRLAYCGFGYIGMDIVLRVWGMFR